MKKIICILFAIGIVTMSSVSVAAMSTGKVRKNTRFLTDRMAHELNLSPEQYNDAYEINFDFIYNVRYLMDDVVDGDSWALDDYYRLLDVRNDDLRWVLSNYQYTRFLGMEYFYRPIFASAGKWNFRVYVVYPNINFFYFGKPYHYRTYGGGHYRTHYNNQSYYRNRYSHDTYNRPHTIRDNGWYGREDFGVTTRPSTGGSNATRPSVRPTRPSAPHDDIYDTTRPGSSTTTRPSGGSSAKPGTTTRPSSGSSTTTRPSGGSSSKPGTTTRPSPEGTFSRPSGSSTVKPGTSSRPSASQGNSVTTRPSTSGNSSSKSSVTTRSSSTPVKESNSSNSGNSRSSSGVSERPSTNSGNSGSSTETRSSSGSSGSTRGGRR